MSHHSASSGLIVLLCEDEPLTRMSTAATLEEAGMTVIEAGDGAEALALLEGLPAGGLDLMVTDIGLPDMCGIELAGRIRVKQPDMPVIFATGHREHADDRAISRSARLPKPYDDAALKSCIKSLFEAELGPSPDAATLSGQLSVSGAPSLM
jgi:DNA-binding LytR/AlgR family response regulator